jgi:uncharacterized membrane protein
VGEHWVRHANGRWAIRRTSTEIETLSPSSPSDADEYAFAVNADGSVIVGQSGQRPMIWIEGEPPRALADVLADDGVDVSDWTFEMATGVSADGKLIVGNGICQGREVGFVARLR